MGLYIVTRTKSNIVFYTSDNSAYFLNGDICYQIVYVDQGKNGHRFASLKKIIDLIQMGQIQSPSDLASIMKPEITWQYTRRRPWIGAI